MDKLEEIHQVEETYNAICSRTTKHDFVKFSKKTSKTYFEDKNPTNLNYSVQSGKNYFVNIYLCLAYIPRFKKVNSNKITQYTVSRNGGSGGHRLFW